MQNLQEKAKGHSTAKKSSRNLKKYTFKLKGFLEILKIKPKKLKTTNIYDYLYVQNEKNKEGRKTNFWCGKINHFEAEHI